MTILAIRRAAADGVLAPSAERNYPLPLRAIIQICQEYVGERPSPPMPSAMLPMASSLIQGQLELITPGRRWPVSAVIVDTVSHHLGAQRYVAR